MKKFVSGLVAVLFLASACGLAIAVDCNYVASKASDKYHLPGCGLAKNINAENKLCFATQEEAQKAGKTPCGVCKPDKMVKVVASKGSDKYHLPTCGIAKNIKPENLMEFKSPEDAAKAGYSPCGVCNPPKAEKVKAAPKEETKKGE